MPRFSEVACSKGGERHSTVMVTPRNAKQRYSVAKSCNAKAKMSDERHSRGNEL